MTKIYLDVLDKPRQAVLKKLGIFARLDGVLAGGTALALQLRHRRSEDFDIFFPGLISQNLKRLLFSISQKPITTRLDNSRQLTITDGQNIKTTLVQHEFAPLHQLVKDEGLPLFHLTDLASNKAFTLGKRGIWRDYVDLFFLLKSGKVTLEQIIDESERRFSEQFAPKLFLEQLVYSKDITDFNIDYIAENYSPPEVMSFLEKEVKAYLKRNVIK